MTDIRTTVVVPTYDEAENLPTLVDGIVTHLPAARILVVDDASPDGTGDLAERLGEQHPVDVLRRDGKLGLGSAYRDGFRRALAEGAEVVVEMDADLSHPAHLLPRLVAALDGNDLVIASRYVVGGGVQDWPRRRRALSRVANGFAQLLTGLPVRDATSGFRAFRRDTIERAGITGLRTDGYAFQVEAALRVWEAGMRVAEVPFTFTDRTAGQSKLSRAVMVEAALAIPRWGLVSRRRHRRATSARALARR